MQVVWHLLAPGMTVEKLGLIPYWISDDDDDPLWKQIDKNYQHGGGWRHGTMQFNMDTKRVLHYPGDPPLRPLAKVQVRDEWLYFYDHAIVAIVQGDGSYEVARID